MRNTQVFSSCNQFKNDSQLIDDEEKSAKQSTNTIPENIVKVEENIRADRKLIFEVSDKV